MPPRPLFPVPPCLGPASPLRDTHPCSRVWLTGPWQIQRAPAQSSRQRHSSERNLPEKMLVRALWGRRLLSQPLHRQTDKIHHRWAKGVSITESNGSAPRFPVDSLAEYRATGANKSGRSVVPTHHWRWRSPFSRIPRRAGGRAPQTEKRRWRTHLRHGTCVGQGTGAEPGCHHTAAEAGHGGLGDTAACLYLT